MKLAVSNIAWAPTEASAAYALLASHGATGLEIAPGLAFAGEADPFVPSDAAVKAFRNEIGGQGLTLVSMQSLLFGVSGAQMFGTADEQAALEAAMERALQFAARLGVPNLVFGSPGNRAYPPEMSAQEAIDRAGLLFRRLGERANALGTLIAVEPNPAAYGTNFLTTVEAAASFVAALDQPGITLNFDIGALLMNAEESAVDALVDLGGRHVSHVHISEPNLAPAPTDAGRLAAIVRSLRAGGYDKWFSIEMRRSEPDPLGTLDGCLRRATAALAEAEEKSDA